MLNAIKLFRFSNWAYRKKIPYAPRLIRHLIFFLFHCKIPYDAIIGKNTRFAYQGSGILMVSKIRLGDNCVIGVNTSFVRKFPYKDVPEIGNNVYISPGAVISGPVVIGNNVIIAPNSVVNKSIPDFAIVGGVPAKIIGWSNKLDYNIFDNPQYKEGKMKYLSEIPK